MKAIFSREIWRRLKRVEDLVISALTQAGAVANAWLTTGNTLAIPGILGSLNVQSWTAIMGGITRLTFSTGVGQPIVGGTGANPLAFVPSVDATGSIGTAALRWGLIRGQTITSGDIELLSEDGEAHWCLREEHHRIVAHNHKTGKTYAFAMEEIYDGPEPTSFAKTHHPALAREVLEKTGMDASGEMDALGASDAAAGAIPEPPVTEDPIPTEDHEEPIPETEPPPGEED